MLVLKAFNGVIFEIFCSIIGMSQREDSGSQIPFRMTCFCWLVTITSFFLKVTSIPPSQTTGIENSGLVISLKTVAFFNSGGRAGICSSMVATDCMFVLLAHWTSICLCSRFSPGQFTGTKWPVAAVSGYAVLCREERLFSMLFKSFLLFFI